MIGGPSGEAIRCESADAGKASESTLPNKKGSGSVEMWRADMDNGGLPIWRGSTLGNPLHVRTTSSDSYP